MRHHSPACAKLVAQRIRELRPRFVLVEGPSDMNARIDELTLAHQLPIAVYTYRLSTPGTDGQSASRSRGTWAPFCDYSPEWVAIREGRAHGARALFIDLPAWDDAFLEKNNRYSDEHLRTAKKTQEIAETLGFDSVDTLWDHMFEQPKSADDLEGALATYFEALRGDDAPNTRDRVRESWMARWIAWATHEAGPEEAVLVVCGGYHKPALERLWSTVDPVRPEVVMPEARVGSYLVPFSFRRLDSFTGYAAGMPSPAFYQALWSTGEAAPIAMLFHAVKHLRDKRQMISTADVVAAQALALGLAQLRGHATLARADVLDGLLGALVKGALTAPAPWSTRGSLAAGTDPILVEIVAAFSGEASGVLDLATPRPPLVDDVLRTLDAVGISWPFPEANKGLQIDIHPLDAACIEKRQVLHRLAILEIPGVALIGRPDLRRGRAWAETVEVWRLGHALEAEATLIERAVYGATLEQAATACILERIERAETLADLVAMIERALLAGFAAMAESLVESARHAIRVASNFAHVGGAIHVLLALARDLLSDLSMIVVEACDRAAWLLEGLEGEHVVFAEDDVRGVAALRDAITEVDILPRALRDAMLQVMRRRAAASAAPPAIRGACLGALWAIDDRDASSDEASSDEASSDEASSDEAASDDAASDDAASALSPEPIMASVPDRCLGDFLGGLFATGREALLASSLLGAVDARVCRIDDDEFLAALPALRRAFSYFPPQEKHDIARRLRDAHDFPFAPDAPVQGGVSEALLREGRTLEASIFRVLDAFGLHRGDT
ncbi:MAG: hypothetical protein H6729_12355 [Deltaproteobacteria bacterium]|nr:hypothetical protein [Deltaproteobacteria bacterium]